jgi:4-hydroxy-3-methylbut-2-enyl diphosphate reductase
MKPKRIVIANPHGFCAGVRRAIESIERALALTSAPVYCLNEIVHNRQVVEGLAARGVVFVKSLAAVPRGACVVFSAHGVAPAVRRAAAARRLRVLDATCPFVHKLHAQARNFAARDFTVLLIGHRGHDEIEGIRGEAPRRVVVIENRRAARSVRVPDPRKVAAITQTTLSVDETAQLMKSLRATFPQLKTPPTSGICRATVNRQEAVKRLVRKTRLILVLGSPNSSNTRRLVEVARARGARALLVDSAAALKRAPLDRAGAVGLTAGASTPEEFLKRVVAALERRGFARVENLKGVEEEVRFSLPRITLSAEK